MKFVKKSFGLVQTLLLQKLITKKYAELDFWNKFLPDLESWYRGDLKCLYGESNPLEKDKVPAHSSKDSAILTWFNIHQKQKYLEDLILDENYFSGMKLLDIGSGPMPSAIVFKNCEVYCLDPLLPDYIKIGFPIHYYDRAKFICGSSENIPMKDSFFDAVISVNAIDHVDNLYKTALEIKRVLKPGGKLRMHVHYHTKTSTEPIEIDDNVMRKIFGWCPDFKKINESKSKRGYLLDDANEFYTVWSN